MTNYKKKYYKYKQKYLMMKYTNLNESSLKYDNELQDDYFKDFIQNNFNIKIINNFLTAEECEKIIELARPKLIPSEVINDKSISNDRTSSGVFINKDENIILKKISQNVSKIVNIPIEDQEDIQIINYQKGQFYNQHYDACLDDDEGCKEERKNGIRKNTFFIYLNDVKKGGYTGFPNLLRKIKPKQGRAVYWNNILPDKDFYKYDPCSLHIGIKPDEGEKWALTVWSRIKL